MTPPREAPDQDIVEMGRRWQRAWTSHRPDANNVVGESFGQLTDEIERLRSERQDSRLREALQTIADGKVPKMDPWAGYIRSVELFALAALSETADPK